MIHSESVRPVAVTRDCNGFWSHPHYFTPSGDEASQADSNTWLRLNHLVCAFRWLENDALPQIIEACGNGVADISEWQPSVPAGDGWFIGSIHDTEDGPVCVWLREVS
ncbi:hypothetical protein LO291_004108 [Salmonella enterica]|nr:hypothetical protein [Salmonella enterica]EIO0148822.1 hypothetical protein [Salmonella enterica]